MVQCNVLFVRVYGKTLTIFPCQGALHVPKLVMPAFGQGKFVRVYDLQRKLERNAQEILLWFWQTKVGLDMR
jgi:hypothetical protein